MAERKAGVRGAGIPRGLGRFESIRIGIEGMRNAGARAGGLGSNGDRSGVARRAVGPAAGGEGCRAESGRSLPSGLLSSLRTTRALTIICLVFTMPIKELWSNSK